MYRRRYLGIPLLAALSVAIGLMLVTVQPPPGAIGVDMGDTAQLPPITAD